MTAIYESADLLALDQTAQDLLFREAHTANTFTDEPVSEDQIRAIYDLVQWAPSSMNAQPLRVVSVRTDDARARLVSHMSPGNQAKTQAAPLTLILAADTDFHDTLPEVFPQSPQAKSMFGDLERRAGFAMNNAWLQSGYFLLGIRAAGLAAGPMGGFDAAAVDADLLAGTTLRSIMVVNVGHPAPDAFYPRNARLSAEHVLTTL